MSDTGSHDQTDNGRRAARWLGAQAMAFGAMAAFLGIVANALFLDAYGAEWLPVTYLFIAVAGLLVSGTIASTARGGGLVRIATVVLAASTAVFVASWVIADGFDGVWVSAPLLVLFPVLLQLGFVFIGGQAGQILDIAGIKSLFPRIIAGFPIGAVIGGLLAVPILDAAGNTESLLLATAVAQALFLVLLLLTARRYAVELTAAGEPAKPQATATPAPTPSMRSLLARRFVVLIIAYQIGSAIGSQLVDFLVFDRAAARYPEPQDLATFVARYTALMNIVSILFLALVAGFLLRRYGLRLGIALNPAVLAVLAAVMIAVTAVSGAASLALLGVVSFARIADIALTDGTTRTSINTTFQVLPAGERLAVQTSVEGVGVPLAIGLSGVIIIVLDSLPNAVMTMAVATAIVCVAWTWVGLLLYRSYSTSLVDAVRRQTVLDFESPIEHCEEEEAAARHLLEDGPEQDVLLGLDILTTLASPALAAELDRLACDERAEVRLAALSQAATLGSEDARRELGYEVRSALGSDDPGVRRAALDAVSAGDSYAVTDVISTLTDPATVSAAAGAMQRLGDDAATAVSSILLRAGSPAPVYAARVVRCARFSSVEKAETVLGPHVAHADRELGLAVLQSLVAGPPAPASLATELDNALRDDAAHGARLAHAIGTVKTIGADGSCLERALLDELDLVRRRVATGRLARHGRDRLGPVMAALAAPGARHDVAVEALVVTFDHDEETLAIPLLRPGGSTSELAVALPRPTIQLPTDPAVLLTSIIDDPDGVWRSLWLRACALHAAYEAQIAVRPDRAALDALGDPVIDELLAAHAG